MLSRLVLSSGLFWSLVLLGAAMLVALLLLLGGVIPVESPPEPPLTPRTSTPAS